MGTPHKCDSCGMPIESGVYCSYCTDETGKLQEFEDRLARLTRWLVAQKQAASPQEAERKALAHMATMPAWRKHPKLLARRKG